MVVHIFCMYKKYGAVYILNVQTDIDKQKRKYIISLPLIKSYCVFRTLMSGKPHDFI